MQYSNCMLSCYLTLYNEIWWETFVLSHTFRLHFNGFMYSNVLSSTMVVKHVQHILLQKMFGYF